VFPDKIVYLPKKLKEHIATAKDNHFQNEAHLIWIVQYCISFHASHVSLVFEKHTSIEALIYPVFSG